MIDALYNWGLNLAAANWWKGIVWPVIWSLLKIVPVVAILLTAVLFLILWERKFIGWLQVRPGPNRLGPWGVIQTAADALKLLTKEIVRPTKVDKNLYFLGPLLAVVPALAAWVVIPFGPEMVVANVNAGILLLLAITTMEIYGVLIAGWSSNSKYPLLGALRASAQMISYELAIGFCFVIVIMVSGSLHLGDIVMAQGRGIGVNMGMNFLSWNWLPLLPICVVYFICGLAECSRLPFDAVEGEAEIVAGHMVEYSGMGFALFFLAEYMNVWLISMITVVLFLGGWLPPFAFLSFVPGWIWLAVKVFFVVTIFVWVRGTLLRFRYDQTMRLGWKIFIPITLIGVLVVAFWMRLPAPFNIWH